MDNPTESENCLTKRLREDHRQIYTGLKNRMESYLLDFAAMNIRYFTNHGRKHFLGVIQQISEMLPNDVLTSLSSSEVLILLCSAWLHDVGLMVNVDHSRQPEKLLTDSEIRNRHPELGRNLIKEQHHEFGIDDRVLADLIADVGYCHSRRVESITEYLQAREVRGNDVVRPQFLAAIIRLADALDTDSRRAPDLLLQRLAHFPKLAQLHWEACQMLSVGYDYADQLIRIRAAMPSKSADFLPEEYRRLFFWKFSDLYKEFIDVRTLLNEHGLMYHDMDGTLDYWPVSDKPKDVVKVTGNTLSNAEVIPLDVILCDYFRRHHEDQGELIFAADWCFQAGREYERASDSQQARKYYSLAADLVAKWSTATNSPDDGQYCWRALGEFYRQKALFVEDRDKTDFLKSMSKVEKYLDFIEENLVDENIYWSIMMLLQSGRSPLRPNIHKFLDQFSQRLKDEGNGESVHGGCCLCTSEVVAALVAAGRKKDVLLAINWLNKQEEKEWRVCGSEIRDYHYTSMTLEALLWAGKQPDNVKNLADCLIERSCYWGKSAFERSPAEVRSEILYALAMYLLASKASTKKPLFNEKQCSLLGEQLTVAVVDYALSYSWQRRELVGLFFLQDFQREGISIDLEHACREVEARLKEGQVLRNDIDPEGLIQKTMEDLQGDPVLNPKAKDPTPGSIITDEKNEQGGPKSIRLSLVKRWTQSWLQYIECQVRRETMTLDTVQK